MIFIGTAASDISATRGHYYSNRGNSFWEILYATGFTDQKLAPEQDSEVLRYDLGLTDVLKHEHSGNDMLLPVNDIDMARVALGKKILEYQPSFVCFTSGNAYNMYTKHTEFAFGKQDWVIGRSQIFITPSSSAKVYANRKLQGKTRLEWFKELKVLAFPQ